MKFALLGFLLVIAACGGGGGSSPPLAVDSPFSPTSTERELFDRVDGILGVDTGYPVWLYRDTWTPAPDGLTGEQLGRKLIGSQCSRESGYNIYAGCFGGAVVDGTIRILHISPENISVFNGTIPEADAHYRRERCFYSFDRLMRFYLHERMHTIGYKHGDRMSQDQTGYTQWIRDVHSGWIMDIDKERCQHD